jgi:2-oxoglutarate ferredoxin oxidoreductase subunit delta
MTKKGKINIKSELCKGCYLCVRACPKSVLAVGKTANSSGSYPAQAVNGHDCIACGNCWTVCPDLCIQVYEQVQVRVIEERYLEGAA